MGIGPKFTPSDPPRLGEPQAHRFKIERLVQVNSNVVAAISYVDATEFAGLKLLVYKNETVEDIRLALVLDPHFLESSSYPKPFARFEPTDEGMKAALELAAKL